MFERTINLFSFFSVLFYTKKHQCFDVLYKLLAQNYYGAPGKVRTCDPRFRRPVLFQLSYECIFPDNKRIIDKLAYLAKFSSHDTSNGLNFHETTLYWHSKIQTYEKTHSPHSPAPPRSLWHK